LQREKTDSVGHSQPGVDLTLLERHWLTVDSRIGLKGIESDYLTKAL
jgi:hypothetical protein